jgi:putative spermidine/putrescine transport system substrate-binding protein
MEPTRATRLPARARTSTRLSWAALLVVVLAACSAVGREASAPAPAEAGSIPALIDAAKQEGGLTTIGLPRSWCNYAGLIDGFTAKYGIPVTELDPDATAADQISAISADPGETGATSPDVVDVGLRFGHEAAADGLLEPYRVSTWDSIPASARDPDGHWLGGYFGVIAFEINATVVKHVPTDWPDLLKPEYKGQIALSGDPTTNNQAISAVWASGIGTGSSPSPAQDGLDFFRRLYEVGNLLPVIGTTATVATGETPIRITWTYHALTDREGFSGDPMIKVTVPRTGRVAGTYVLAISRRAPHPNAAKLWMEYLFSDEGQLLRMDGFCDPIRRQNLVAHQVIPDELRARIPDSNGAVLPTLEQIDTATKVISEGWDATVGLTIR